MKAAGFELARPRDVAEACKLLTEPAARVLAGGQSLGPMLNLRIAHPGLLVQISRIAELQEVDSNADSVTIGACVTHAAISDGGVPDVGLDVLRRVAEGIAYRAVRTRGTIGGSLCHADPAADWVTVLTALGASMLTSAGRVLAMAGFVSGAFRTDLCPNELLVAVCIPRLSAHARWAYVKTCRKPGDFAHAMTAVLIDPARSIKRAVVGATGGAPIVLDGDAANLDAATRAFDPQRNAIDPVTLHVRRVILARALAEAGA